MAKTKKISALRSCMGAACGSAKILTILFSVYSGLCIILGILMSLSLSVEEFMPINFTMSSVYSLLSSVEIIGIGLALVSALRMFGKYTKPVSNNLIKSLPANDRHLFWSDFSAGLLCFIIPVTISLAAQTLIGTLIESAVSQTDAYATLGVSYGLILNYTFAYCIAVLCFSVSSGTLEGSILFIVLNFIPSVVDSFISFFKTSVLGVFQVGELAINLKLKTTYDIIKDAVTGGGDKPLTYIQVLIISLLIIVICALVIAFAYFAFSKLRSSDKISFRFKKIISTVAISLLSFYFGFLVLFFKRTGITLFNSLVIVPTMIIASFFVFYLANTLINKSLKIQIKSFAPFTAIAAVLIGIGAFYFTGGFGSAMYIPRESDIKSVTVNFGDEEYHAQIEYALKQRFTQIYFLADHDIDVEFPITYDDYKSIKTVVKYHNALLEEYGEHNYVETVLQQDSNFPEDNPRTVIEYKLKNGKTVYRYYNHNGNDKTLYHLARLDQFNNSVEKIESRALSYVNRQAQPDVIHTLQIFPIHADQDFSTVKITDEQMQTLVKMIYEDEKLLDEETIIGYDDGDYCTVLFVPQEENEEDEENLYFDGVFNPFTDKYFTVKKCYTKTIAYLTELGVNEKITGYPASDIKQIFAGKFGEAFGTQYGFYAFSTLFKYSYNTIYSFDYFLSERYYNTQALKKSEKKLIDGDRTNTKAVKFLISKLRLFSLTDDEGIYVMLNRRIVEPFNKNSVSEQRMAIGKQIYYVSGKDWKTFIKMCK